MKRKRSTLHPAKRDALAETAAREDASAAARALRAIPSDARAEASRENGKLGGRPRKTK